MKNFLIIELFESVEHEILQALTFKRAFNTALINFFLCFFFFNTAWIQTWDVEKSALSWWMITISLSEIIWRMFEKRQSDEILIVSIFSTNDMNVLSKSRMFFACQFSLSLELKCFSTRNLISFFRAIFQSMIVSLKILIKFFSNFIDLNAIVNDWRISRISCNMNSAQLDSTLKSSMSCKIRTLHTFSLHSLDWKSDLNTSFKNEFITSLFNRLSYEKNDHHMKSHRQTEMTCWTSLSLRNSEISICQIDIESKIEFNLLNFWWTAFEFCVHFASIS